MSARLEQERQRIVMHRWMAVVCMLALVMPLFARQGLSADRAASAFVYVCRDAGAGGYQAFPDVCRLRDGRLMCVFYASYHHIGLPCPQHPKGGRIAYCTSTNEGHSWSKAKTLYDGPDDDRDPSIVQLKNGQLICNFFSLHKKAPLSAPFSEPLCGAVYGVGNLARYVARPGQDLVCATADL